MKRKIDEQSNNMATIQVGDQVPNVTIKARVRDSLIEVLYYIETIQFMLY